MSQKILLLVVIFYIYGVKVSAESMVMPEIIVEASKIEDNTDLLSQDFEINNKTKNITDVGDLVESIPGVNIPFDIAAADSLVPYTSRGFSTFNIRGLGGNAISLTIDGIRQPQAYESMGGMGRTFFDPSVYESLNLKKGTASADSQSDSIGGSIDFKSSTGKLGEYDYTRPLSYLSRIRYKSVSDTLNLLFKNTYRNLNSELKYTGSLSKGHERKNDKGLIPADPMDYNQNHHLISVKKNTSKIQYETTLEHFDYESDVDLEYLVNQDQEEKGYEPGDDVTTTAVNDFADNYVNNQRSRVNFKINKPIHEKNFKEVILNFYYQVSSAESLTRERSIADPLYNFPTMRIIDGVSYDSVRKVTEIDDIKFNNDLIGLSSKFYHEIYVDDRMINLYSGLLYDIEDAVNTMKRYEYTEASDYDIAEGNSSNTNSLDAPYEFDPATLYRSELFIQSDMNIRNFNFELGARFSDYRIKPDNLSSRTNMVIASDGSSQTNVVSTKDYKNISLTKSAQISHRKDNYLNLISYSEGIRNPSLEDYLMYFKHGGSYEVRPNPDLKAEKSKKIEYRFNTTQDFFDFGVNIFHSDYENFIETRSTGESTLEGEEIQRPQNVTECYIKGTEMDFTLYLEDFYSFLQGVSFNFKLADIRSKNQETGQSLESVSPKQCFYTLKYNDMMDRFGLTLSAIRNYEKKDGSEFGYFNPPASTLVNASAYFSIGKSGILNFSIRNVLDEKYWLWPNAGRTVHSFEEDKERSVMPGRNFIISYSMEF